MRLVVADAGPIHYLVLIGHVDVLPILFETVIIPLAVRDELSQAETPLPVRTWISTPPLWVEIRRTGAAPDSSTPLHFSSGLGAGESAAILLATEIQADLVLMDDRRGVAAALRRGLFVTGTMGLLARAAKYGLIDLAEAFNRLKLTNFRYRDEMMDAILAAALDASTIRRG